MRIPCRSGSARTSPILAAAGGDERRDDAQLAAGRGMTVLCHGVHAGRGHIRFNQGPTGLIRRKVAGGAMGKYDPLRDYLAGLAGDEEPPQTRLSR